MSIEAYEELMGKFELYGLFKEGLNDIETGNIKPLDTALKDLKRRVDK